MSYHEIKIDIEQIIKNTIFLVSKLVEKLFSENFEEKINNFKYQYETRIAYHKSEDNTDYLRLRRLITEFQPSLANVIEQGYEFDQISGFLINSFETTLGGAKRQITGELKRSGVSGFEPEPEIRYFCSICKNYFEIPVEKKEEILNSEEKLTLPSHHGIEMQIRIENSRPDHEKQKEIFIDEDDFSVHYLMNPRAGIISEFSPDVITVTSVGIDIGSSTSHLIFSRLTLVREVGFLNMTGRYLLENRKILYEGAIINTPLINETTIDLEAIITFIEEEYKKAGIKKGEVDTGAVIVTGETAKKKNAEIIVNRISSESGKFVSATAGPNYESVLGIMGSGILDRSRKDQKTYINIDIGGGTSNLAIASHGVITSTSCINIGGRLLGIEKDLTIWRIDPPTRQLMKHLQINYSIGEKISLDDLSLLVKTYSSALIEAMLGKASSKVVSMLMMTSNLEFSSEIDAYSFSGGIGELIYSSNEQKNFEFRDIGVLLAKELKNQISIKRIKVIEPDNKIRATVIGAGAFSLSVSGTTCHVDESVKLPLNNIPVIPINLNKEDFSIEKTKKAIKQAIRSFDIDLTEDLNALYFDEPIYHVSGYLSELARGIEFGLQFDGKNKINETKPIILIFKTDLAKMLSIHLKKETNLTDNMIILDEITLEAGDWIDIGEKLKNRNVYPVTIKSLVFKQTIDK